jgi:hypothetical protein
MVDNDKGNMRFLHVLNSDVWDFFYIIPFPHQIRNRRADACDGPIQSGNMSDIIVDGGPKLQEPEVIQDTQVVVQTIQAAIVLSTTQLIILAPPVVAQPIQDAFVHLQPVQANPQVVTQPDVLFIGVSEQPVVEVAIVNAQTVQVTTLGDTRSVHLDTVLLQNALGRFFDNLQIENQAFNELTAIRDELRALNEFRRDTRNLAILAFIFACVTLVFGVIAFTYFLWNITALKQKY